MNSEEIMELKKTWAIPYATPTDSGVAILTTFLSKYPYNLQKFYSFKHLAVSELKTNARFRKHAINIIQVFNETIETLGNDSSGAKLEELWSKIAVSHVKRKIEKQSYNELREAIIEVLTQVCNLNEKQLAVWNKLMDLVYEIIFNKMNELKSEGQ